MQVDGHNKKSDPLLEQLSTEELERLLRTPDGTEPDIDFILKVMEVIQSRESESDTPQPNLDRAWNDFQENYQGQAKAYEINLPQESQPPSSKQNGRKFHTLRWAVILAAVLLLLCGTASAFGLNVFQVIADWTSETFRFTLSEAEPSEQAVSQNDVYADLRKAVAGYTDTPMVPTWAPDGTEAVEDLSIVEYENGIRIQATYEFHGQRFTIRVQIYNHIPEFDVMAYQKDNADIQQYEFNDVVHYVMKNNERYGAAWTTDTAIIFVQGALNENEILNLIESIYRE